MKTLFACALFFVGCNATQSYTPITQAVHYDLTRGADAASDQGTFPEDVSYAYASCSLQRQTGYGCDTQAGSVFVVFSQTKAQTAFSLPADQSYDFLQVTLALDPDTGTLAATNTCGAQLVQLGRSMRDPALSPYANINYDAELGASCSNGEATVSFGGTDPLSLHDGMTLNVHIAVTAPVQLALALSEQSYAMMSPFTSDFSCVLNEQLPADCRDR